MTLFWTIAIIIMLITNALILLVFFKKSNTNSQADRNEQLHKLRLDEIKHDKDNGLITETDFHKIIKESEKAFQIDNDYESTFQQPKSSSNLITYLFLFIFIPVFTVGLYSHLGSPGIIERSELITGIQQAETVEQKRDAVENLLNALEDATRKNPDDLHSWVMLNQSYFSMGRFPEALRAVENIHRLNPEDHTVQLRFANLLFLTSGTFDGLATELINSAIAKEPTNPNGLWLAGMAASERENYEEAVDYWQRLLPLMDDDPEARAQLQTMIDAIKPDNGQQENDVQSVSLTVDVSVSQELKDKYEPDDTLFIYAKALSGIGMPLAIIKKTAGDLPLTVTLDDSTAMTSEFRISQRDEVQLIARISRSGDAKQQSGDLLGILNKIKTNNPTSVKLQINQTVQ